MVAVVVEQSYYLRAFVTVFGVGVVSDGSVVFNFEVSVCELRLCRY